MGSIVSPAGILTQIHTLHKCKWFLTDITVLVVEYGLFYFTCKRSDSGMSECSSRMEVSNSISALVTMALLVLPLPALFAITCSDRRRSCDSSGMSRRRKTTSNRERRAEPILKTRMHYKYLCKTTNNLLIRCWANLLQIFRNSFASVVMSSSGVRSSYNWRSGRQRGNYSSLSQTYRLLLHGFKQSLLLVAQLIKLINAAQA